MRQEEAIHCVVCARSVRIKYFSCSFIKINDEKQKKKNNVKHPHQDIVGGGRGRGLTRAAERKKELLNIHSLLIDCV